jgi:putative CocE/NonD family hydrolase
MIASGAAFASPRAMSNARLRLAFALRFQFDHARSIMKFLRFVLLAPVFSAALTFVSVCQAQTSPTPEPVAKPSPSPAPTDYDLRWAAKIPMRDRVELNATLYLPKSAAAGGRTPAIFTLTPYISDSYHARAAYFASKGYAFALVDVRGRGNSGGDFEPFANEARDGHDVVEWLATQPFCDGKVAMWGGSYAGFDQWATAKELPPHLATIVPVASAHPGLDFPFNNNVGICYDVQWFTFTSGRASQQNLFADSKFWRAKFLEAYRQHLPFKMLDSFIGNPTPNFQRVLKHPMVDAYYDAMVPTREQFAKIALPILSITGQYDGDEIGALAFYRDHLANASAETRAKHFLIIGPWDHAGTRTPTDEVGGVKLGGASVLDLNDLHRQWYDWTLKGGSKPDFLKDRVAYYSLAAGNSGANGEWLYASDFAKLTANRRTFYLMGGPNGAPSVFESGKLTETAPTQGADEYVYDPLDIRRGEQVDKEDNEKTAGIDQHFALSINRDGLVYHTDPITSDSSALIGCPKLTLWLTVDVPDTDFSADLYEILPDGTSIALWTDVRRLRYRESPRAEKLVKPGEIVRCDFAPGLFVGRRLSKGSRLRLVVTSPNSIFLQKNYNSGGAVAEETAKDAHTAHVRVLHDAQHASALDVPLVPAP